MYLREACDTPPVLFNEAFALNNWQARVPGLWELALFHNGTVVPKGVYSRGAARWDRVAEELARFAEPSAGAGTGSADGGGIR
eukprot:195480-Prymnesium_polylepis.1